MASTSATLRFDEAQRNALGSIAVGLIVSRAEIPPPGSTRARLRSIRNALESTINVVAACVALFALRLSAKPADAKHPYGHQKVGVSGSVFEGALILVARSRYSMPAWGAWNNIRAS